LLANNVAYVGWDLHCERTWSLIRNVIASTNKTGVLLMLPPIFIKLPATNAGLYSHRPVGASGKEEMI
jgi:hypothetical protein